MNHACIDESFNRICEVRDLAEKKTHTCHANVCNPLNEAALIRHGKLIEPAICNDVYVCRYQTRHVCTELLCENLHLGVCPISGKCYGVYGVGFERIVKAKRLSGDIVDGPAHEHVCHPDVCNPQNEPALIRQGALRGPPVTSDLYVCRYKVRHVCTEMLCDMHDLGVCTVSGACYGPQGGYSSYDRNNPKTWGRNFSQRERIGNAMAGQVRRPRKKAKNIKGPIGDVIEMLLFSPARERVNQRKLDADAKRYERKLQNYLRECKTECIPPCLIYIMMMRHHFETTTFKLEKLRYNEDCIAKYTDIVMHVWELVDAYHPESPKLDMVTIGVLYGMQQGFIVNGTVLLPSDTFLLYNLPAVNDLPMFGIEKRKITSGQQLVELVFKRAIDQGAQLKDIAYIGSKNGQLH